jgi:hypothetical protein
MNAQTNIQRQAIYERHAIYQIHLDFVKVYHPPPRQFRGKYPPEGWNLDLDPELNERNYQKTIRSELDEKLGFERYTVYGRT